MKTKKKIFSFLIFLLTYIPSARLNIAPEKEIFKTPEQALAAIANLETTFKNQTPLQFSMRSLKSAFEDKTTTPLAPQSRRDVSASKTTHFNKSLLKYIKEIYNEQDYAEALSQNGTNIIDFLELSSELSLGSETTYIGIRLFYNKLKACEIVDDTMLSQVLPHFTQHLDRFFYIKEEDSKKVDLNFIKKNLETTIIDKITSQLPEFQKPATLSHLLTNEIITVIQQETDRAQREFKKFESNERLRQIVIRFLELTLGKLMWNPKSPEGIWQSFLKIANDLQLLGAYGIIDHMDDLDDNLWSLTHRFCYFLDLTGSVLPLEFYEEIEHDLSNKLVFFLEAKEQDDGIMTKKETISRAVLQAKTKAFAYQQIGLITQPL